LNSFCPIGGWITNECTDQRNFLKQVGLMGSIAMMPGRTKETMGLSGGGRVMEDAVLPQVAEGRPSTT
jgi:hypothetical protein